VEVPPFPIAALPPVLVDLVRDVAAVTLTPEERAALVSRKAEVLALLRAEHRPARTEPSDRCADDVPDGLCGRCGSPLACVEDWPMAGEARWLCPTCAAWPAPSLAEVFQTLTAAERRRLDAEAADGDALARAVLRALAGSGVRRATE
jgi:hypothetical protein